MKRFALALTATSVLTGHSIAAADHRVPPVFAICDTAEGLPMMNIQVRKYADNSGVMVYLATLQPGTRYWSTDAIVGKELDLGRDPICEVYEFNAKKNRGTDVREIHVCFERHENGTYGGVLRRDTESGFEVERPLRCSYPTQQIPG
ncbi:MAG: hypothetical protein RIQ81_655 [Pseudomonadota bacterium]|jgi:hypothetical protein